MITNFTQDDIYQDESITPIVIVRNSSNLLNSKTLITNYSFTDISDCIWPRFLGNSSDCVAQLPEFLMKNEYNFKVGSNIDDVHIIPAFYHSLNAKFIITVTENGTVQSNKWLTINQTNSSIVISTDRVNSVSENKFLVNARMITFDINQNNTSSFTTLNYIVDFTFLNEN